MQAYNVGETVVHWIYGVGKIVAIEDKGLPGESGNCCYVIEGCEQTLWVPVDEIGSSSLHKPTTQADFNLLINNLRSQGEAMSNNPHKRGDQLGKRMQKASPKELSLVIRDLNYRSQRVNLTSNDIWILQHAQIYLLDEWELSLGTPREKARIEMESILKESLSKSIG